MNPNVFLSTVGIIALFLAIVIFAPNAFELMTRQMNQWITTSFRWFYVLSVAVFLIVLIVIALSDMGKIKLGPDHSQPEYGNGSWFAMLFTAGMGIGLMFFGVAEPIMHYVSPPTGDPQTIQAAQQAMRITFFHWGLHAWAIYAITFNQTKKPLLALMGALIMVQLMLVGGDNSMVKIIGKEFAAMAGEHWVYFSPYLGAIGAFFSFAA